MLKDCENRAENCTKSRLRYFSHCVLFTSLCLANLGYCQTPEDNSTRMCEECGLDIRLRDPTLERSVLSTSHGGVIKNEVLHLQAREITYNQIEGTIKAHGDLMLIYDKRVFIGKDFYYNIKEASGTLIQGKTYDGLWIIGGDTITFDASRSITIQNAFLTASETDPPEYDIIAKEIKLEDPALLRAKATKFRVARIPIFYLPVFKANLDLFQDTSIRYNVTWDRGQGPKFSMRYRIYSWEEASLFFRFDFRVNRGFGGAFETDYKSKKSALSFKSKSYLAHDTFWADFDPNKRMTRWRLQGIGRAQSEDKNTRAFFRYDWISDRNMPGDFPSDDFELNTAKRTEFIANHINPAAVTDVYVRPNINKFQGFKQELPTLYCGIHPVEFGSSKIMMNNALQASFLDYAYPRDLGRDIPGFHSIRLESHQTLYRPFHLLNMTLSPNVGYRGILYSKTPQDQSIIENLLTYGIQGSTTLTRHFKSLHHFVKPYAKYESLRPMKQRNHYIFDLRDGYERINELKIGLENTLYTSDMPGSPRFLLDVFAYRFFDTPQLTGKFAKIGSHIALHFPRLSLTGDVIYNNQEKLYDKANLGVKWTLNEYFAIGLDFLHRSKYYYRKDNEENFILDVTRPASELINTPISDQRNLFLVRTQLNIPPNWTLQFESHTGWGRRNQPSYMEYRIDLYRMITSHWKFRLSYMQMTDNKQVSFGLSLISF
ncbi:MAG: hypothetical protein K9M07_00860 [Simkaniaceae bacterium]|nr:hypothetical protein [Simkaniaceae bacterium]MCF7851773.1 hypothetical protein [Simkaniaceae bacterium]